MLIALLMLALPGVPGEAVDYAPVSVSYTPTDALKVSYGPGVQLEQSAPWDVRKLPEATPRGEARQIAQNRAGQATVKTPLTAVYGFSCPCGVNCGCVYGTDRFCGSYNCPGRVYPNPAARPIPAVAFPRHAAVDCVGGT